MAVTGMSIAVYSVNPVTGERTVIKERSFVAADPRKGVPAYQPYRPCECPRCRDKPPEERAR
ncbi:hypothetical protein GCM10027168_54000 [Streptomyces capparidis]